MLTQLICLCDPGMSYLDVSGQPAHVRMCNRVIKIPARLPLTFSKWPRLYLAGNRPWTSVICWEFFTSLTYQPIFTLKILTVLIS